MVLRASSSDPALPFNESKHRKSSLKVVKESLVSEYLESGSSSQFQGIHLLRREGFAFTTLDSQSSILNPQS
jgi:hypothetical protein